MELLSRTLGIDRIIDEFIFSFTHDRELDWLYVLTLPLFPLPLTHFPIVPPHLFPNTDYPVC